jgi:hypothetical protein
MSKITPEHLTRQAIVYVRQSTADQVANNLESQRRQYGLVDRARQLGWSDVAVIDDDLGRSGGGIAWPGFEKLLAERRRVAPPFEGVPRSGDNLCEPPGSRPIQCDPEKEGAPP